MQQPFDSPPPFQRVTQDETTAVDRQWLRLLWSVFEKTDYQKLIDAGLSEEIVREFLGVTALAKRYDKNA